MRPRLKVYWNDNPLKSKIYRASVREEHFAFLLNILFFGVEDQSSQSEIEKSEFC